MVEVNTKPVMSSSLAMACWDNEVNGRMIVFPMDHRISKLEDLKFPLSDELMKWEKKDLIDQLKKQHSLHIKAIYEKKDPDECQKMIPWYDPYDLLMAIRAKNIQ